MLRVYGGKPWLEDDHFGRLERSLASAIRISGVDVGRLRKRMEDTIRARRLSWTLVYIQVTRRPLAPEKSSPSPPTPRRWSSSSFQEFNDPYATATERVPASSRCRTSAGTAATSSRRTCWPTCCRCRPRRKPARLETLALPARWHTDRGDAHQLLRRAARPEVLTRPNSNAILPGITPRPGVALCCPAFRCASTS